jgi:hypothetical protein
MTVRKSTRAERREVVERLLREHHDRSDRSIARLAGASHTLVANVRRELVAAGVIAARPCRPEVATQDGHGNLLRQPAGEPGPAMKHGAYSAATLAQLRTRHLEELRARFPDADDTLVRLQAQRLSRHQVLTDFFDQAGLAGLIQTDGKPREAALLISRLEDAIERCHARLSGEGGANGGGVDPYAEYQRIVEGKGGADGVGG